MRKSIPVAFFSLMSTLLIFGTVVMGGSELVLFSRYFAQERYDTLDEVVNVAQRTASYLVQEASLPEGEELESLSTKLEIIGESAEAYLFFTDCDGNVLISKKQVYAEAFTIYAYAEYALAFNDQSALKAAMAIFAKLETVCYDKKNGA